jgi:hypothetical protein
MIEFQIDENDEPIDFTPYFHEDPTVEFSLMRLEPYGQRILIHLDVSGVIFRTVPETLAKAGK